MVFIDQHIIQSVSLPVHVHSLLFYLQEQKNWPWKDIGKVS